MLSIRCLGSEALQQRLCLVIGSTESQSVDFPKKNSKISTKDIVSFSGIYQSHHPKS